MLLFLIFVFSHVVDGTSNINITFDPLIPFFVMKPHVIINQTLHSYCKEQSEFNSQPMFINLTEWPSGFIYSHDPYTKSDEEEDYDEVYQACTVELRAASNSRIRLLLYSMNRDEGISDDYERDYSITYPKTNCLKLRDSDETISYNCPTISSKSEDYLSQTNVIYLELLQPFSFFNDYEEKNSYRFQLFFTSLTLKALSARCPHENLIDCNDTYCAHANARCNGLDECRTKFDEDSCPDRKSASVSNSLHHSFYSLFYFNLFVVYTFTHGQTLF